MQARSERFEMRLDRATLDRVDEWRGKQRDLPSRAEAIRRLIETGLSPTAPLHVRLTDGEKLIVSMLRDVYKNLKISGEIDPEFVTEAITKGHYWGLKWRYAGIFHGQEDSERVLCEVLDMLEMWSFLERGNTKLSPKDRARVKLEAKPFGNVRFPGFDGNEETEHLGVVRFLIERLKHFTDFEGRNLNAHFPCAEIYRRMLRAFEAMRQNLMGRELTASEIITILRYASNEGGGLPADR